MIDGVFLALIGLGAAAAVLASKLNNRQSGQAATQEPQPAQPATGGGPVLDAILQILKQLGEHKPIAGIEATVKHPNANITISLTKEETHVSRSV